MAVNAYIVVDIMKPTPTVIDLSGNFNGRVGDSQSYIKIWFKSNGLPLDLTNLTPYFEGKDSNGTPAQIVGTAKADQTGDNLQTGRVTFYFPAGIFQVEGMWDETTTFFGIRDDSDTIISTVNVSLNVLANGVEMGIDKAPFLTDLQKIVDEMKAWVRDQQTKISETENDVLNSDSTLNKTLAAVKGQVTAYQAIIDSGKALTQADLDAATKDLNTAINSVNAYTASTATKIPLDYLTAANGVSKIFREQGNGKNFGLDNLGYVLHTYVPINISTISTIGLLQEAICVDPKTANPMSYRRVSTDTSTWSEWMQVTFW